MQCKEFKPKTGFSISQVSFDFLIIRYSSSLEIVAFPLSSFVYFCIEGFRQQHNIQKLCVNFTQIEIWLDAQGIMLNQAHAAQVTLATTLFQIYL